jgi:2-polyprenyl-6-methoxyphenol hydroxylase-like FAD-dependent oxidoreductase
MSGLNELRPNYDALIVGARCAGAATALLLARHGLRVLVVDRSAHGSDTLSTLAIMRGGVMQMDRWGVLPAVKAAGTPTIRTTTFHYADQAVEVPIKVRDAVDGLYAPRRAVLDSLLADAASDAGATIVRGARVAGLLTTSDGRVRGAVVERGGVERRQIGAGMVIGADGAGSTVARLVDAEAYRQGRHSGGVVYGFWAGLDVEGFHWHFAPGVSAGVIPTNGDLTLVFAAVPRHRFLGEIRHDLEAGYHRVIRETSPGLAGAVSKARRVGTLRGFAGQVGHFRQSWGPGWALVGDAGYFKDPITAHGITDALRDAEILARAVLDGSPRAFDEYQRTRDDLALGLLDATDEIAGFEWDLERLKERHLFMSREMNREVAWLTQLGPWPARSAPGPTPGTVAGAMLTAGAGLPVVRVSDLPVRSVPASAVITAGAAGGE